MPYLQLADSMELNPLNYGLAILGLVWYLAMWSIGLLGCVAARRRYRSRPMIRSGSQALVAPGVSILRPLKGLDHNLYENLESTFKQDYSNYEIIFSVAHETDQALHVVNALVAKYPQVPVTVIIGEEIVGVNPKVNNLMRPFRKAAHDLLWVIDSGVMVDAGTLSRSVNIFTDPTQSRSPKRIGIVHHVPFALVDENKIGSRIEAAFLNTNHAKMYIAINTVAVDSCVVGKSNMYRRSDIEHLNASLIPVREQVARRHEAGTYGLAAFGRFLAEDNTIAAALWHELGLRHDLSCDVARNVIGNMSFMDYVWRRVRWIRVRKHMVLAATLLEPFTESIMVCTIGAICLKALFRMPVSMFVPLHFFFWLAVDLDVYASISGYGSRTQITIPFLSAWFAREILAFPIWLIAITGNVIIWRGQRYQVLKNGEAKLCSSH